MTQILDELTESGFITPMIPFDRKVKDSVYRLSDEYSHFYLKFIENTRSKGPGTWTRFSTGGSWKSWSGYAFESVCMKHFPRLKKALGIECVHTEISVWRCPSQDDQPGVQIDLLIDRRYLCINSCEIKFSVNDFEISKFYAKQLDTNWRADHQ
jgi:hypothetical protein